jgi:hypothetical protein
MPPWRHLNAEEKKEFFFEKKNQKTFAFGVSSVAASVFRFPGLLSYRV